MGCGPQAVLLLQRSREVARIYSLSMVPLKVKERIVTGKSKKLEYAVTLLCILVKKKIAEVGYRFKNASGVYCPLASTKSVWCGFASGECCLHLLGLALVIVVNR